MLRSTLVRFLAAVLFAGVALPGVAQAQTIAGKCKLQFTKAETMPQPDGPAHMLMLFSATCPNENAGKSDFMAGATFISHGYADLVAGSGPSRGYTAITKGGDEMYSRWEGRVQSFVAADGSMRTGFVGTWESYRTAGRLSGRKAGGVFTCYYVSATECMLDWSGDLN
jgi:hypothetical protein